jgi:D-alanyl-lipoteichoic acid acyltransferase DltB (MBOAT superfamily)
VLFNSYVFLYAFLPIALAGYFLLARCGRVLAALWLIAVSFVFYGWWNPVFVPLLVLSMAANYGLSLLIGATERHPRLQIWVLATGIAANLGALCYYKYLAWLIGLLNTTAGAQLGVSGIVLPLGISFFTFTQLGYLIDCKQGVAKDRGCLDYLVFVTFFPHLIAGPILHNGDMMPQFATQATYRFSGENLAVGLGMFALGLLKKCLLADPVGTIVPAGFTHPADLHLFAAWQVALSYSLQLYFDFSGYSDMAIGLARMFNLRFPLNFNSPYKAASVIDYWQRWHMTLTRYLMTYLYNPIALGIARRRMTQGYGLSRAVYATQSGFASLVLLPIFVTMSIAGIWHGAGAQFLVFGLLHAVYLSINHAWRIFGCRRIHRIAPGHTAHVASVLLTYLCVLVGSVFFRAPSVTAALTMLAGMLGLHGIGPGLPVPDLHVGEVGGALGAAMRAHGIIAPARWQDSVHTLQAVGGLACLYATVWFLPNTQEIFVRAAPTLDKIAAGPITWLQWQSTLPWAVALGCASALGWFAVGGTGEFLYFQF